MSECDTVRPSSFSSTSFHSTSAPYILVIVVIKTSKMKAVFGLTVVISLILAIAAAAIIYLTSYTFSSHPTLLVFKQNPAGSTSPISLYAYKSQTTKIKKEDDKDKFASANIAFATDNNVPQDTTVTPIQEEELAFATKPEDPFKSDQLPDFKIKSMSLLINPVLSKDEKMIEFPI